MNMDSSVEVMPFTLSTVDTESLLSLVQTESVQMPEEDSDYQ